MKSLVCLLAASSLLALGIATSAGCTGAPKARAADGERLPANGAPSDAPVSALPSKTVAREDWNKAASERLRPSCDAREGARTANVLELEGADKVIGSWTRLRAAKGKSKKREATREVLSVGMTCAAGASTLQVNGRRYPFDLAWVVSGEGKGTTLNGDEGAGRFAMIEALSFTEQRVVFAKVWVPSDANDDTDDVVIVTSLEGYLPDDPAEPIVHAVGDPDSPKLETLIFSKEAAAGISLQVPDQDALGRTRYVSVARFTVEP